MQQLETQLHTIKKANSAQEVFDAFVTICKEYGYTKVSYGLATDHASLGLKRAHGHMNCFPSDWMGHYQKNNLIEIDPVPKYILKCPVPTFWSDLKTVVKIGNQEKEFMNNAAEAGLRNGALFPLYGAYGEKAGITVSNDDKVFPQSYENLSRLNFLCLFFHEKYKSFIKKENDIKLSPREYEILSWAAAGKTDPEISIIINISVPTVRYHWKSIFRKLDANSRTYAIVKAIYQHLVKPYSILLPYQNR